MSIITVSYNELFEQAKAAKRANDDECMLILFFLKSSISFPFRKAKYNQTQTPTLSSILILIV